MVAKCENAPGAARCDPTSGGPIFLPHHRMACTPGRTPAASDAAPGQARPPEGPALQELGAGAAAQMVWTRATGSPVPSRSKTPHSLGVSHISLTERGRPPRLPFNLLGFDGSKQPCRVRRVDNHALVNRSVLLPSRPLSVTGGV